MKNEEQLIDNVIDLAKLSLSERLTLTDLINENRQKEFEVELTAKAYTIKVAPNLETSPNYETTLINGKIYIIVSKEENIYIDEQLAKGSHEVYPIFANNNYFTGYIFSDKDKAIDFADMANKLWKGAQTYLMMRELHHIKESRNTHNHS